jgi:hypothetical protein
MEIGSVHNIFIGNPEWMSSLGKYVYIRIILK